MLWIFLLFLLQNVFYFIAPRQAPSLLLIGVIFYALSEGPFFGLMLGLYAGFFVELFWIGRMGYPIVIFGLLGLLAGYASSKIFRESLFTQILLPTVGYYLMTLLSLVVYQRVLQEEGTFLSLLQNAFLWPNLIWTALLSPFIFSFLKKFSFIKQVKSASW